MYYEREESTQNTTVINSAAYASYRDCFRSCYIWQFQCLNVCIMCVCMDLMDLITSASYRDCFTSCYIWQFQCLNVCIMCVCMHHACMYASCVYVCIMCACMHHVCMYASCVYVCIMCVCMHHVCMYASCVYVCISSRPLIFDSFLRFKKVFYFLVADTDRHRQSP
jgi:hypothetical protein